MEWSEYKRLCDQPTVLSRFLIELTKSALPDNSALAARLSEQLSLVPLVRPLGHKGPPSTDMFATTFAAAEAHAIAEFVGTLPDRAGVACGVASLAGVRAAWRELADHLAAAG